MSGPHWVRSSVPGPTCTAAIRATRPSTNASCTGAWTKNRFAAVQAWPPLRIFATIAPSSAASRSASSRTTNGALPPSSIAHLRTRSAAVRRRRRPTAVEPVKDSMRVRVWLSIASTTGPGSEVVTTLTTPAGSPASSMSAATASAVSGVSAAGFSTTVHPAASAGAILRVAIAAGKFHGVTSTLTPTGWWVTTIRFAPLGEWPTSPRRRTTSSAYHRKNSAA